MTDSSATVILALVIGSTSRCLLGLIALMAPFSYSFSSLLTSQVRGAFRPVDPPYCHDSMGSVYPYLSILLPYVLHPPVSLFLIHYPARSFLQPGPSLYV